MLFAPPILNRVKDAFKNDNFNKIDEMLINFCYLHKKSPKHLQELKRIAEAWKKSKPKPSKSYGTPWIDHKVSLSQTDSQALKRAELKGYLLKWKDASLVPLKGLKLSFQQELHDPVKVVHCIQDFNLTIGQVGIISRQIFRKS